MGQRISKLFFNLIDAQTIISTQNVYVEVVFVYWTFQNVSIPTDFDWLEFEMFPLFCFSSLIHASF